MKAKSSLNSSCFSHIKRRLSLGLVTRITVNTKPILPLLLLVVSLTPGGISISGGRGGGGGRGGLDLTSSLEETFGARSSQVYQIRGKTWEILLPQDVKVGKNPNFGIKSEFQRAEIWGICHLYFWRQIWGSNKNFRGKLPTS